MKTERMSGVELISRKRAILDELERLRMELSDIDLEISYREYGE